MAHRHSNGTQSQRGHFKPVSCISAIPSLMPLILRCCIYCACSENTMQNTFLLHTVVAKCTCANNKVCAKMHKTGSWHMPYYSDLCFASSSAVTFFFAKACYTVYLPAHSPVIISQKCLYAELCIVLTHLLVLSHVSAALPEAQIRSTVLKSTVLEHVCICIQQL